MSRHAIRGASGDVAPVIAAEALLRHGMHDDDVFAYIARTWSLDEIACDAAVRAARILLRHEARADPDRVAMRVAAPVVRSTR